MSVVLDQIDESGMKNRELMKRKLVTLFHLDVQSYEIKKIDYVRDVMELQIVYLIPDDDPSEVAENKETQSTVSEFPVRNAAAAGE